MGDLFIDHQMRVNEIYVAVKHRPLPGGVRFLRWRVFYEPMSTDSRLVPDGYLELDCNGSIRPIFLEIDLGHQSMKIWEQKTRQYLQFAVSGDFSRIFRQNQFRVAVVTTSRRRLQTIRAVIAKQTDKMFWLSDFKSINQAHVWSPIWFRPTGDQECALI